MIYMYNVQLQYNGMPLPPWSVQGHNVTPKKVTYLENFPADIQNTTTDNYNELLNELNQRNVYKPQGRPPYASADMPYIYVIHHAKRTGYFLKDFRCHICHF